MFVIYQKLNQEEAKTTWKNLKKWFKDNEDRDECHTDMGLVRRDCMKKDFLHFCADGVKLK